jgi:hypothetical protein
MGGQERPEVLSRMAGGEVQGEGGGALAEDGADLEECEAEGVELERGLSLLEQPGAEGVEQIVGGGMQEEAELVGPEAMERVEKA